MDVGIFLILGLLQSECVFCYRNESQNHYIIQLHGYYNPDFRKKIVTSAFGEFSSQFSFVPRHYAFIPLSDFEIVSIHSSFRSHLDGVIAKISSSPLVKSVFADKPVHLRLFDFRPQFPRENRSKQRSGEEKAPGSVSLGVDNQPWRLLSMHAAAWSQGLCGSGVHVGIFDTGLTDCASHPHFRHAKVKDRSNWTWRRYDSDCQADTNPGALDSHGHGTFVTGLIAASAPSSIDAVCPVPGLAPRAELHVFRVFTDSQLSTTSWFLDAFNYAIVQRLHVINLSNGGPDFKDQPFVDKVNELSANGILLVSAIGNDGPLFGTLNNPGDMADVLGVGGVDATGHMATFASRGSTAMEMQDGYGRFKPDVVAWATGIRSSSLSGGCKALSGTSAASPIVTGAVALLISAALSQKQLLNRPPINPASLKQAIVGGATLLRGPTDGRKAFSIFEQGAGLLNLTNSIEIMRRLKPQATLWPSYLDFTDCPYFWPYCSQPLYASGAPVIVNVTITNSMGVHGTIRERPVFHPLLNKGGGGILLDIGVIYSRDLWPWTGHLALHIAVRDTPEARAFSGLAEGWVSLKVESYDPLAGRTLSTDLKLPLRVPIIPTPERRKRILWDVFHNIRYPSAYVPTDDLTRTSSPLDWLGDHIHTNYRDLYQNLREAGYFVEVLQQPFTCFDASNYGTLMIVDPEEEFWPEEISKLTKDIKSRGLSAIVFGGWFNTSVQAALKFFDSNNRRHWVPITGGVNLPALNRLLAPFDIQFGDLIYGGRIGLGDSGFVYASGSHLVGMPGRSRVLAPRLVDISSQVVKRAAGLGEQESRSFDSKQRVLFADLRYTPIDRGTTADPRVPILGLWESANAGRLAVFGDSNCFDSLSVGAGGTCFWLVRSLLEFTSTGHVPEPLQASLESSSRYFTGKSRSSADTMKGANFEQFSRVLRRPGTPPVYRPLLPCREPLQRALIAPVSLQRDLTYGLQPLLLRPPDSPPNPSSGEPPFPCHEVAPEAYQIPLSALDVLKEYIAFLLFASAALLVLINARAILAFCSPCGVMRCLRALRRCLLGRRQAEVRLRDLEMDRRSVELSPLRSAVLVESVQTRLGSRLAEHFFCKQREQPSFR